MSLAHLIPSLEPKLRELYDQHIERAAKIDWAYYEYLPLDELKNKTESIPKLSPIVYASVETALLTEINLPWFTTHLHAAFKGSIEILVDFVRIWTSEEDQHALLLDTYLLLGDHGDHRRRSRLRKSVIRQGWATTVESHFQAIAYTAIQELATQIFYLRTAELAESEDPLLARALRRLARDETLHMAFYRDCVNLHLHAEPNYVYPLAEVMMNFEMPGAGMPDYRERTELFASDGNYGPYEYYSQVIDVLWRYWEVDKLAPTLTAAREKQKELMKYHARLGKIAARFKRRKEAEKANSN